MPSGTPAVWSGRRLLPTRDCHAGGRRSRGCSSRCRSVWALSLLGVNAAASACDKHNLALAGRHAPAVRAQAANAPRFAAIGIFPSIDVDGRLVVEGDVASRADLNALTAIVNGTSPPADVERCVHVVPPAAEHR